MIVLVACPRMTPCISMSPASGDVCCVPQQCTLYHPAVWPTRCPSPGQRLCCGASSFMEDVAKGWIVGGCKGACCRISKNDPMPRPSDPALAEVFEARSQHGRRAPEAWAHPAVTVNSQSTHSQLTVNSQSTHSQLMQNIEFFSHASVNETQ